MGHWEFLTFFMDRHTKLNSVAVMLFFFNTRGCFLRGQLPTLGYLATAPALPC